LCAVGLTGGIVLLGIGLAEAASADGPGGPVTSGESGILSGNQTGADAQAPVNVSGNQVTVVGQDNKTTSTGSSSTTSPSSGSPTTSGQNGIGSGNQTGVAAQVPVDVSGNQVTVIGQDNEVHSTGGSSTSTPASGSSLPPTTSGESGIASGNQTAVTALVPVNASGNQVTVIGQDNTVASPGGSAAAEPAGNSSGPSAGPVTSGESGVLSGNQTGLVALVPVNASGNQVTVIGQDNTVTSTGTTTTGGSTGPGGTTTGENGGGSGNQTQPVVGVPVNSSGNQVTVIGQDNTDTSTSTTTTGGTTTGGGTTSPPAGSVVSPPISGSSTGSTGAQAVSAPVDTGLPNTGAPADLLGAGLLGLLLMLLGGSIVRREGAGQ
jgi:hypothetical protein